jgi:hypothetical protein
VEKPINAPGNAQNKTQTGPRKANPPSGSVLDVRCLLRKSDMCSTLNRMKSGLASAPTHRRYTPNSAPRSSPQQVGSHFFISELYHT